MISRWMRSAVLLAAVWMWTLGWFPALLSAEQNAGHDKPIERASEGMRFLMDGNIDGSIAIFREVETAEPESALGYVLEADANWWKIYLTEGNLIDPDVFEALSEKITPYDPEFSRLNALAIHKAEAQLRQNPNDARSLFYQSMAYALQSRLDALRDHSLATARSGKKMRHLALAALKADPNLNDAYLAVGIYNYFVDTLPGYVKMLRFLIALPGGDRELGLRQLQTAAEKGEITRGEAAFHLAKNYSRAIEQQFPKSLQILQQMEQDYPNNPLWKLLIASLRIRMGDAEKGEAGYREVVREAAGLKSEVWKPLHDQAQRAIDRRHGK